MKSFDSKSNPIAGLFVLGAAVPTAVYLIGFITVILLALIAFILLPFFLGGLLDWDAFVDGAFVDIAAIVGLVLQCAGGVVLTVLLTVFFDLKAQHVLLSLPVTAALFFLVERFFRSISTVNFPEAYLFFPKLYKDIGFTNVDAQTYFEMRLYLINTLLLTAGSAILVLLAWGVVRIIVRHEEKQEL